MAAPGGYNEQKPGFGSWWAVVLGVAIGLFGALIFGGGIWLLTLGGSAYYVLAGIGLLLTAYFLIRRSIFAVWVYLVTFIGALAWALWGAGMDGWVQVPRLVAPTVLLLLILLTIPALRRHGTSRGAFAASVVTVLAIGTSGVLFIASQGDMVSAGEAVRAMPSEDSENAHSPANTPLLPAEGD